MNDRLCFGRTGAGWKDAQTKTLSFRLQVPSFLHTVDLKLRKGRKDFDNQETKQGGKAAGVRTKRTCGKKVRESQIPTGFLLRDFEFQFFLQAL